MHKLEDDFAVFRSDLHCAALSSVIGRNPHLGHYHFGVVLVSLLPGGYTRFYDVYIALV